MRHFHRLQTQPRLRRMPRQTQNAWQRLRLGKLLLTVPGLLLLSSCRSSQPPKIEICIGDGVGGAECVEADGTQLYRTPSMLNNYWMTGQSDEANFASWCYESDVATVQYHMNLIKGDTGIR